MAETYTRRINIYIDSGQALAAQEVLLKKQEALTASIKKYTDAGKEVPEKLTKQYNTLTEAIERQNKKISGELSPNLKDLSSTYQKLNAELSRMSKEDAGFTQKQKDTLAAKNALDSYKTSLVGVKQTFAQMLQDAKGVALGVLFGNTMQTAALATIGFFKDMYSSAIKISDEFADIEKTTNLSAENVAKLNSELSKIDTRTGNSKLRQFAVDAGKLGKEGVQEIKEFVRQADQIDVALGKDLGEGAITDIGKIADIFQVSMLQIASGINEVGQKSSASEAWQKDFMFRTAGMAKTTGLLAGEILGYGAALDINGMQVEASSTALQTTLIDFTKNTEKFGKAAGMVRGELTKIAQEKGVNTAFITFLKNLKDSSESSDVLLRKLEDLGIDGARGASTFLTLANNIGLVEEQQKLANDAIAKGSSVTEEFEKRNHNFAASTERLSKAWATFTASGSMQEFMGVGVDLLTKLVKLADGAVGAYFRAWNAIGNATTKAKEFYASLSENVVVKTFNSTFDRMVINPFRTLYNFVKENTVGLQELNNELDKTAKRGPLKIGGEEIDMGHGVPTKDKPVIGGGSGESDADRKKRIEQAAKIAKDALDLKVLIQKQMAALGKENLAEEEREYQAQLNALRIFIEKKKSLLLQELAQGLITEEEYKGKVEQLEIFHAARKIEIANQYKDGKNKATEDVAEFEIEYQNKVSDAHIRTNKAITDSAITTAQKVKETWQSSSDGVKGFIKEMEGYAIAIWEATDRFQSARENKKFNRQKKQHDDEVERLRQMLSKQVITQQQYDKKVETLDRELARKKHELDVKQFKRQQALSISKVLIAGGVASMKAWEDYGWPWALIPQAFIAGMTAMEVATISQQEPPSYGTGAEAWRQGLGGDPHSAPSGGNPIINPQTGQIIGKVEKDEAIIPAANAQANMSVVRALINAKGRSISDSFAMGHSSLNAERVSDNMQWAAGGLFGRVKQNEAMLETSLFIPSEKKIRQNDLAAMMSTLAVQTAEIKNMKAKGVVFQKDAYDRFNKDYGIVYKKAV